MQEIFRSESCEAVVSRQQLEQVLIYISVLTLWTTHFFSSPKLSHFLKKEEQKHLIQGLRNKTLVLCKTWQAHDSEKIKQSLANSALELLDWTRTCCLASHTWMPSLDIQLGCELKSQCRRRSLAWTQFKFWLFHWVTVILRNLFNLSDPHFPSLWNSFNPFFKGYWET